MKAFKIADCVAQVLMIGIAAFMFLVLRVRIIDEALGFYFAVGGWQIMSVIVHLVASKLYGSPLRKAYHILLLITIGTALLSALGGSDGLIMYMAILLGWSPILAVLYMIACIKETNKLVAQSRIADSKR